MDWQHGIIEPLNSAGLLAAQVALSALGTHNLAAARNVYAALR